MRKHKPVGPFAPPLPTEAEETHGGEPMAVAGDKANMHGESFVGTSSPRDAFDDDVAAKYGRPVQRARGNAETREMQSPGQYTKPNENGWARRLDDEETR